MVPHAFHRSSADTSHAKESADGERPAHPIRRHQLPAPPPLLVPPLASKDVKVQEINFDRPLRRISNINLTLAPLREQIGELNERMVVLIAQRQRATVRPAESATGLSELERAGERLEELCTTYHQVVQRLPSTYQQDSRLRDTREALSRLTSRIVSLVG